MIKVLEQAIEKIKNLPEDKHAYAVEVLEQLVADANAGIFDIADDHLEGVLEGLDQARRGEFATDTEIDAAPRKPWR
jgi:hypothetical protein